MTMERALASAVGKPWGSADLRPWSGLHPHDGPIGEIWFERAAPEAKPTALLLKLLFTSQALSIQVHPDDELAHAIGLPNGKSEAWYVLSAAIGAKVACGLSRPLDTAQLTQSIEDGSIADLIAWRHVRADDFISVPAGTIHTIGAGLVIAEIQQRSDATFRLFDFGFHRELRIKLGVQATRSTVMNAEITSYRLSPARMVLTSNQHFVIERLDLLAMSSWRLSTVRETWLLIIEGECEIGLLAFATGEAAYLNDDAVDIDVGSNGMRAIVAYAGSGAQAGLLREAGTSASETTQAQPAGTPMGSRA